MVGLETDHVITGPKKKIRWQVNAIHHNYGIYIPVKRDEEKIYIVLLNKQNY